MTIAELLRGLNVKEVKGPLEKTIEGITYNSKLVHKGYLFVAVRGFSTDGHRYIEDAINRGSIGVVAEKACAVPNGTALVEVDDSRVALALLSSAFYREPSRELSLVGITGTNGKTTTSFIVKRILEAWGKKAGLLGTIHYEIDKKFITALHTTPESLDLQKYLREMVERGMQFAVLEVSSHALSLHRVEGCTFQVAAFTNFSQDHLDFHGSMEEYYRAKSRLFQYLKPDGFAVLNWDDQEVRKIAGDLCCRVITCGFGEGAVVRAINGEESGIADRGTGLSFSIQTPEETFPVSSHLMGRNNAYNILMSAGIAYAIGIDKGSIIEGIQRARAIEGRFEVVEAGQDFLCIVDYAHTEDALRSLIQEARRISQGRIITVFGCGGDRDRTKRPNMGSGATDLSDVVVITSDNPRTENPDRIIRDITDGIIKTNYHIQPDRVAAIQYAVSIAKKGDTLLIAGKGHEDYQEIQGVRYPFSDKEVFRKIIKKGFKGIREKGM
jgi:UDP-N-acetylmuramoyl-L-alanyl-D-glutamate--2,6-diaminopimelate ligase